MPNERELKFSLLEDHFPSAAELRQVFESSAFELLGSTLEVHKDKYFDDAVGSLKKAGMALRRRTLEKRNKTSGTKIIATLKTLGQVSGALHEREEIETVLTSYTWSPEILARITPLTDPHLLRSHLEFSVERRNYPVAQHGQTVALLSFDDVTAKYTGAAQSTLFTEAEIEATGNTAADTLQHIATLVAKVVPLAPNTVTKLERAEALLSLARGF